jgi:hypothetical protein
MGCKHCGAICFVVQWLDVVKKASLFSVGISDIVLEKQSLPPSFIKEM